MKKILILILILCLAGCAYKETEESHDDDNKETVYLVMEADSFYADGTKFKSVNFSYDEDGRILCRYDTSYGVSKFSNYVSDQGEFTNISEYDEKGRLVKEQIAENTFIYEYENDNLTTVADDFGKTVYEYNDRGQVVKRQMIYTGAEYTVTYEYDGDNLVKETGDDYTITRVYDEKGRLTSDLIEYGYDYPRSECVYAYDEEDRMIGYKITDMPAEDFENKSWYKWEYDSNGNCVMHTIVYNAHSMFDEIYTYEYDDDNRLIKEEFTCDGFPDKCYSMVKEYDDNGNLIRWSAYDADDNLTGYTEYVYVEHKLDKSKMTLQSSDLVGYFADEPDHPRH